MSRRIECRSEGCSGEVVFKTVDGVFVDPDRRPNSMRVPPERASPNGYHRGSTGSTQMMSPYCKQHTCSHFIREEGCNNKKPPHDSVCAVHARCPIQDCNQARAQYLDPKYDYVPGIVPRYTRYDLCFDHKCTVRQCQRARASSRSNYCQMHGCHAEGCLNMSQEQRNCCPEHECNEDGCRTIVEGEYPYCVIHIKCEIDGCNHARHLVPKTKEYLDFCIEHATCEFNRCREIKADRSPFCANHTCRERDCERSCFTKPYCDNHVCAEAKCEYPKLWLAKHKTWARFCPMHTCRDPDCEEFVISVSLYCAEHGCSQENCLHEAMAENLCISHFKEEYMARGGRDRRARDTTSARDRVYERPFYSHSNHHRKSQHDADSETGSETVTDTDSDNEPDYADNAADDMSKAHQPPPRPLFTDSNLSKNSRASKASKNSKNSKSDDATTQVGPSPGSGPVRREWTRAASFPNGNGGGETNNNHNVPPGVTRHNSTAHPPTQQQQQQQQTRKKDMNNNNTSNKQRQHWATEGPSPRASSASTSRMMDDADSLLAENGEDAFSGFGGTEGGSSIHPLHPVTSHTSSNGKSGGGGGGKRVSAMMG